MELNLVTSVELARRYQAGRTISMPTVRCSVFHPSEPHLFIAADDEVYMSDALQGQIMARFSISAGQIMQLFPSRIDPLLGALVALEDEFVFYVWNLHEQVIKAAFPVKHMSPKKPGTWASFDSKLFYAQQGTKAIYTLDWKDGSLKKADSPKPVQSLHMHPLKPQLGCILGDGAIRVVNTITNSATMWNESPTAAQDKPVLLAFHPSQPVMLALTTKGMMMCWNMNEKDSYFGSVNALSNSKETIDHVFFHGTLPLILTVNNNGAITTWNFFARKNTWIAKIVDGLGRWEMSPAPIELANRYGHLPNFASKFSTELVVLTEVSAHPSYNYFTFNFRIVGKANTDVLLQQHLIDSVRLGVYCVHLIDHRGCNMIVPQQQSLMFWASPHKEMRARSKPTATNDKFAPKKQTESSGNIGLTPRSLPISREIETREATNVFYFSNEAFLLDDLNLLAYAPAYNDISLAKKLPATDYEGILLRPTRVVRSNIMDRFLVFFMRQDLVKELTTFGVAVVCRDTSTSDVTISPAAGQCGIFFGSDEEFLVLSESGAQVEIWKNEEDTTLPMIYDLPSPMSEVFWTPLENSEIVWFMDPQRSRLISSFKNHISGSKFMLNSQCSLQLQPGEEVYQVCWHGGQDDSPPLAALVTSRRVLIVNGKLQIIASAQEVASSCLWLGAAVVFNTKTHLMYLTVRNAVHPLISLRLPDAVLVTLLNDRVALAVRRAGETSLVTNAVGIMEPLIIGFLHYFEAGLEELDRKERNRILLNCAESYDARRISWQLVEEVTKHGYREFALQLLLANPHLLAGHHQFAFELALTTHHYSTAFTLIERSTILETAPNLFRLQRAALKLGQFDVARKCAECTSDWTTLLYLYTLSKNKEGLLTMKRTLERDRDANVGMLALIDKKLAQPDIASLPSRGDLSPISSTVTPLTTNESQKLLARQDSRLRLKLAAKNFYYTPQPILTNMSHITNKRWKVENHAQVSCEMRTMPIEGGSGNLLVGPLLLNTLLGDWFTRQVPYFELPEALQGDAVQRAAILKLLADKQADMADRQKLRAATIVAGGPVPTLSLPTAGAGVAKTSASLTARSHATSAPGVPTLALPGAGSNPADQRSPRKMTSSATLRPMSTVAANLITAIANSGPKSSEGSPSQGMGEESSSPTESDSFGRAGTVSGPSSAAGDAHTTQMLALAELALTTDPLVLFTRALGKLELADYDGCILDLNAVLLSLLASNSASGSIPAPNSFLHEQVRLCTRYKLVCMLLHQIRKLDEAGIKAVQVAQLSQFLADIPVMPRHRLVLLRIAAKKNLLAQNYGCAAACLTLLATKGLPDSAKIEKQLEECKSKNLKDADRLAEGTKLCAKSFSQKWITEGHPYVACRLCNSSFHPNLLSIASPCPMCFWRGATMLVRPSAETRPAGAATPSSAPSTVTKPTQPPQGIVIGPQLSP